MARILLLLIQHGVVARLHSINHDDSQVVHVSPMGLVEMLAPHPSLAILPVSIVSAYEPPLVKSLTNIFKVVGFTPGNVNNPTGFTIIIPPDKASLISTNSSEVKIDYIPT